MSPLSARIDVHWDERTGGNTLGFTGALTNGGNFQLNGSGDMATIASLTSAVFAQTGGSMETFTGTLTNSGSVDLENASTLRVNGAASNSGTP